MAASHFVGQRLVSISQSALGREGPGMAVRGEGYNSCNNLNLYKNANLRPKYALDNV